MTVADPARRRTCRACDGRLDTVFVDLGKTPPANAYLRTEAQVAAERSYPLCARVCDACLLVQLDCDVAPEELFDNYAYFSSYSETWLDHARRYVNDIVPRLGLGANSLVVEVASNDGYLLRNFVERGVPCLGVDPSDTVAAAAEKIGVRTEVSFFSRDVGRALRAEHGPADLTIANNVLAHVPDINDFLAGFAELLGPDGVATFEFPHLLELIRHIEFDTIYHEHFSYISLYAVERALARHGLSVADIQTLGTHGGSLRLFCRHAPAEASAAVQAMRAAEAAAGLDRMPGYAAFGHRVESVRAGFRAFLSEQRTLGRRIAAYGAAAKGNTFLNYCGVTRDDVAFVADRNPHKQNALLPGTHIPVVDPSEIDRVRPDIVLILPWNLREEIAGQLLRIRDWGGQFAVAVPEMEVF